MDPCGTLAIIVLAEVILLFTTTLCRILNLENFLRNRGLSVLLREDCAKSLWQSRKYYGDIFFFINSLFHFSNIINKF